MTKPNETTPPSDDPLVWRVLQERELIDRCAEGAAQAWSELYLRFHSRLLKTIEMTITPARNDLELVEEIAARVWYALVRDECRLLKAFDPERGASFATYLSIVAKSTAFQYFRAERRRRRREFIVSKSIDIGESDEPMQLLDFADVFLESLSPQERRFYHEHLMARADGQAGAPSDKNGTISEPNAWQLRHRVLNKLRTYIDRDQDDLA